MSWPEIDIVGTHVGPPVTVYGKTDRTPGGELAHEGNRVPDIVALDSRRLVVGWRAGVRDARDPSPTDQGAIMYARSDDAGRTWTVGTLAAATATRRYHYVMFLDDGGVLYALLGLIDVERDRDRQGRVDGFPTTMTARRSTDAGRTWTDFPITVEVPDNGRGVVVAGRPLRHGGHWLVPYWRHAGGTTRAGVLRSADLRTWTPGALAENPPGVAVEEPQIAISYDDPGALVMVTRTLDLRGGASPAERDARYRAGAAHCATATSADGGLTWSRLTLDEDLPNYYVKTFFTRDSGGRHLAIYNTLAGPFTGPAESKPDQYREVLHYKVRRPGEPWGPGRLFADGRRLTRGAARGWDVYPSADEYEPGKFFVVWEHNQTNIKVAGLDVTRGFGGDLFAGDWELYGGARRTPGGGFVLRSGGARPSGATRALDVRQGCDFVLEFRGRVDDDSALDPRTGEGVCLGAKVANGARRLMLAVQRGGVWSMRKGSSVWERVHSLDGAGRLATWRVAVDSSGVARLSRDGADTGARWVIQDSRERPQLTHWVTGTPGGNAAAATVEWTRLSPAFPEPLL
ncbi:sialidase family protein [Planobispora longispora]|uniref:Sialidase domain-containing protein n=1 Tax=Planobispora longispora TaxID=28887 RepID=A0A8J3RQJ7_9ACTN|nr:sialidase family protein [Planobispora longispora]GIH77844.1 hypothetical protein Plo01_42730 [Planobispora longispora]